MKSKRGISYVINDAENRWIFYDREKLNRDKRDQNHRNNGGSTSCPSFYSSG